MSDESSKPAEVQEAERTIRAWQLRDGHDSYVQPLNGGFTGYQARCWNCEWIGPVHLRGDEPVGTPESRRHKMLARDEAYDHRAATKPEDWRERESDS